MPELNAILRKFANAMGMSWEEAAMYLMTRSLIDLISSAGWSDLRKSAKRKE